MGSQGVARRPCSRCRWGGCWKQEQEQGPRRQQGAQLIAQQEPKPECALQKACAAAQQRQLQQQEPQQEQEPGQGGAARR